MPSSRGSRRSHSSCSGEPPRVTHRWAGIWGTTEDLLPLVGQVPGTSASGWPRGYSGHGNVLGFACGELVARALGGDRDPLLDAARPGARRRRGLEAEARQVELVDALERRQRDREVLDREAGRVEDRDSSAERRPSAAPASTAPSSVTSARSSSAGLHRVGDVAAVARLLPLVGEDADARELLDCDLLLAGPVGAHQRRVLARCERAFGQQHLATRRDGDDEVGGKCLFAGGSDVRAELGGDARAPALRRRPTARRSGRARETSVPRRGR